MIRHPAAPPPRLPEAKLTFGRFPISRSIDYNRDLDHLDITGPRGFHHIRRPGTSAPDRSSIIVAIAGACPNNGTGDAQRSSCGDSCRETRGFRVDSGPATPHTNQRAELHAAIAALDAVKPFCEKGGHWGSSTSVDKQCRLTHVVVKSHSSYIVEAVGGGKRGQSPCMKTWMANGFVTAQGLSIKNLDLWQEVLQRLRDLQKLSSVVEFWLGRELGGSRACGCGAIQTGCGRRNDG
uniref:RNase H type-1 domain-containing protein n=1 Tax=Colletotrichum fructicola (strain Nara gc5) TaxID=1213859 RepID=L2FL96_COLFN